MQKRISACLTLLLALLLTCGCFPDPEQVAEATVTPAETPAPTQVTLIVDVPVQQTEPPTAAPVPTDTPSPVPTDTPEPNPYAGTWTVLNRPFSLTLNTDKTYVARYKEKEIRGAYQFDDAEVSLSAPETGQLLLRYENDADVLRYSDCGLIRSDLIAETDSSSIPVTFEDRNDTVRVRVRGGTVEAELLSKTPAQQFCITAKGCTPPERSRDWFDVTDTGEPAGAFRFFKTDGAYTLWIRDAEENRIASIDFTVASGFSYPLEAEGLEPLRIPLERLLSDNGSSVGQMNAALAADTAAAGLYTRPGVVSAAMSLISRTANLGAAVPYQGRGTFHAGRDWGVNPNWGQKQRGSEKNYTGMHDVAALIWAYKQAGMNLYVLGSGSIAALGELQRGHDNRIDYDRAESGDLMKNGGHYLLIADRLDQNGDGSDDAYLVYEMRSPVLCAVVYPFSRIQKREFYSMDAFFAGTGRNQEKVNYWKEHFRIPEEDLPPVLTEAAEKEKLEQSYELLLMNLGL